MKRLLVIRFSALGDVTMTIPVLWSLATQYPDLQITVLSRRNFSSLFEKLPSNVTFIAADLNGEHKGIWGLFRLFRYLKKMKFDGIADLHDVLRSKFLRICFLFSDVKTAHIRKGRKEKRKLTKRHHKVRNLIQNSFERYHDVFKKLGYDFPLSFHSIFGESNGDFERITTITGKKEVARWIGVAPFAKHIGKIYPLHLMEKVIENLSELPNVNIFLFGGSKEEKNILAAWEQKYSHTLSIPDKLNMSEELVLMSQLDLMISMDSANMHMASIVNTPVISIWGATHPICGFSGWNQVAENEIQTDLPCRPCSVFGNKPCFRKDYACLNQIDPESIISHTLRLLNK